MKPHPLAKRYARALFELAERANQSEDILSQFKAVDVFFTQQPRIKAYLYSPLVDKKLKIQLLKTLFKGKVADLFLNFIILVLQKGRQQLLPEMYWQFKLFCDRKANRLGARVISAVPVDSAHLKTVKEQLSRYLKAEVVCENEVDENILGGLIVTVGGKVVDGSLRYQLQRLRDELLQVKYNNI
ncbi:ATP synthase F1 subunit delta [candidate division KSB1 bacterium]|nr:ATP synthase F1 subunit delta [candidate division KSB1 bacterium]